MTHIYPDGKRDEILMEAHEVSWTIDPHQALMAPGETIQEAIHNLGSAMAGEMERDLFQRIRDAPDEMGGMFGGSSAEEVIGAVLESFRKMQISFDHDGKPSMFLAIAPGNTVLLAALQSPELSVQVEQILQEKKREWITRESHRRLVD